MLIKIYCFLFALCIVTVSQAQTIRVDVQDTGKWTAINRTVTAVTEGDKKAILFNEVPNDGLFILKEFQFRNGTIEFDVKGKNVPQQSFVGIAVHIVDEKTYDAVYFRPFNFKNEDTARRSRSVQYVSMPQFPWEKLRENFPGKYENKVAPVPDGDAWFHVKIVVDGKKISAYVNNNLQPSLQVEKLTSIAAGRIGLWVGNNSGGHFANLSITPAQGTSNSSPATSVSFHHAEAASE